MINIEGGKGLNRTKEVHSKIKDEVNSNLNEEKIKRGYSLRPSTIKKLDALKLFCYPVGTSLEDIVDEAICYLYNQKNLEK